MVRAETVTRDAMSVCRWFCRCGLRVFPIRAPDVEQKLCVGGGLCRSRSWPAASPSALVSPPWSLWPVWTRAPRCRAARPAAAPPLREDRHCISASESQPRKPCCCGSGSSATSRLPRVTVRPVDHIAMLNLLPVLQSRLHLKHKRF